MYAPLINENSSPCYQVRAAQLISHMFSVSLRSGGETIERKQENPYRGNLVGSSIFYCLTAAPVESQDHQIILSALSTAKRSLSPEIRVQKLKLTRSLTLTNHIWVG